MTDRPEVACARRLIELKGLVPPINIPSLIREYASLDYAPIPLDVDGLCLELKVPGRTRVIINNTKSTQRQIFTAAHELGHIIIPWHVGSIIDTDVYATDPAIESILYKEQEAEANRFASELLMPTEWIVGLHRVDDNPCSITTRVMSAVGVSAQAVSIKLKDTLPPGYAFARYRQNVVDMSDRTRGTIGEPPKVGTSIPAHQLLLHAKYRWELQSGSDTYVWWRFGGQKAADVADDDWRSTLAGC